LTPSIVFRCTRASIFAGVGSKLELAPRPVTIHELTVVGYDYPKLVLNVHCSSGTYVRSLGRDLAESLGTGAVMSALVRTAVGKFCVENAIAVDSIRRDTLADHLLSPQTAVEHLPKLAARSTKTTTANVKGRIVVLVKRIERCPEVSWKQCSNAFLPGHLTGAGRPDLISATLTALNFGQVPASFALLAVAGRLERRALPFIISGALMLSCLAGLVSTASGWTVAFAGVLGFLTAVVLTLGFALPPLLSVPAGVARMSAAMFTISYSEALVVAVLSGAAWDFGGSPQFAFLPIAISALPLLFVPAALPFHRPRDAATL
jgi:hypothetical protein